MSRYWGTLACLPCGPEALIAYLRRAQNDKDMKKTFLSLVLLAGPLTMMAQRTVSHGVRVDAPGFDMSRGDDTLVTPGISAAIAGNTLNLYASNSGFILGNNDFGDKAKAQYFPLTGAVTVDELLFFFGGKVVTSGDPNSKIVVKLWGFDGNTGVSSNSTTASCPGAVLSSVDILASAIDTTGNFTSALLPAPVWVGGQFCAGFDVTTLAAGDSVGCVGTEIDGAGVLPESLWELWSDDVWHTFKSPGGWGFEMEMFVATVLTSSAANVGESAWLGGAQLSLMNGNVVDRSLDLLYALDKGAKVSLMVHDGTGREVVRQDLGTRAAGQHSASLDASNWNAGQYYVTLVSNGTPLTKKVSKL